MNKRVLFDGKMLARRKYGNTPTEYNGRKYHSKAEAKWAQDLDALKSAGKIRFWLAQHPKFIVTNEDKPKTYTADFMIVLNDGTFLVADCKGFDTAESKLKRAIVKDKYGVDVLTKFEDILSIVL